jgi:serine/threonine protein kinase
MTDNNHLGPYELKGELGRGAMAKVWRAFDPKLEREVAVKEPLVDERLSDDVIQEIGDRFVKEGKAAARLNHPGIVTIYAADVYEGRPAIVMELIDGVILSDMLEKGSMDPRLALDVLDQLLDAVGYAHSQGIIHRDIKPDTIFVTSDGRIKLTDFGIAHIEDSSLTKKTQVGTLLGTPGYMAPEQATGSAIDNRTDLFAIGTIAYEMLAGKNPFGVGGDTNSTTLIYRIVHEQVPGLPDIATEGLPTDIRPAVIAALNKNPDERPTDAASFKAMLHGAPAPAPGTLPAPTSTLGMEATKAKSSASTKKWLPYVLVGGAGAIILIVILAFALGGGSRGGGMVASNPTPKTTAPEPNASSTSSATTSNSKEEETASNSKEEETNENSKATVQENDDYIISDSDRRYISSSEIYVLSDWERFIARNEIFARHGRGFKNPDLRNYFESKSWYSERYSPEVFDSMPSLLNDYELKNAALLLQIEKEAGSPYAQ